MLEIVAEGGTETHGQAGGSPLAPMIPAQRSHRITLPRKPGESPFVPQQYCYAASKSGVTPSLPLSTSVSTPDRGSDVQRDAA